MLPLGGVEVLGVVVVAGDVVVLGGVLIVGDVPTGGHGAVADALGPVTVVVVPVVGDVDGLVLVEVDGLPVPT